MCAGVDLCITLGGDGTVLHLASLFVADEPLPPVVSFAMGTLGFLTPFDVTDFADTLSRVWDANGTPVFCTLRTRKCCEVFWCAIGRNSFQKEERGYRWSFYCSRVILIIVRHALDNVRPISVTLNCIGLQIGC